MYRCDTSPFILVRSDISFENSFFLFLFRCFINQVHELIELGSDDDLRTTVALFAHFRVVAGYRVVLDARKADKSQLLRIFFMLAAAELTGTLSVLPSISTS